jgi:cytochrome P450
MVCPPQFSATLWTSPPTSTSNVVSYRSFDKEQIWLIVDVFPNVLAPDAFKARAALQSAFRGYYDNGYDRDAGALVSARNQAARKFGLTNDDLAQSELSILFVATTNAVPTIFWLLIHILADPQLVLDIREELEQIVEFKDSDNEGKEGVFDIAKFTTHTPIIHSAYQEVTRLFNAQVTARQVTSDTVITDPATGTQILLKKGNVVQMPAGIPHRSSTIWGSDAERFDARRFIKREELPKGGKEKKDQTQGFLPFGGGKHLCPGRYFAQAEILGMAGMLILGYEFAGAADSVTRETTIQVPEGLKQQFGVLLLIPD